jgi:hypothetical protein
MNRDLTDHPRPPIPASPFPPPPPPAEDLEWGPGGWVARALADPGLLWREGLASLRALWVAHGPLLLAGGGSAVGVLALAFVLVRAQRRARWAHGARWIEITAPPQSDPHGAELLWATLDGLRHAPMRRAVFGQAHISFEIHATTHQLRMGILVGGPIPAEKVERAIRAAWPGARTHTTHFQHRPDNTGGEATVPSPVPPVDPGKYLHVAAGRICLARSEALPLRSDQRADPLRAVLAALTELPAGRSGCVQILARPAGRRRARTAQQAAHRLLTARPTTATGLLRGMVRAALLTVPLALTSNSRTAASTNRASSTGAAVTTDPSVRRAVHDKTGHGVLWSVQLRYASTLTAPGHLSPLRQTRHRSECIGRADTLGGAFSAYTGHNRPRRARLYSRTALTHRQMGRGQILSVPELAALAHLPLDARASGLTRAGAQQVTPPPQLPTSGHDTKPLGTAATSGRAVAITVEACRGHMHVQGQTGTGKSTFLAGLALADIRARRGVVLIEPKGDLARDVHARIPAGRRDKLIVLDPDQPGPPPLLNLLDPHHPASVEHLIGIFANLYPHWGHRLEQALRVACLTEIAHYHHRARLDPNTRTPHLGDVLEIFTDDAHRHRATHTLTGPPHRYLRAWWASYHHLSPQARELRTGPLTNRLLALLLRPFPRAVLTGTGPPLDIAAVINNGGICLARLPEGTLDADTVSLLGSLLVSRTWHAATHRAHLPEDQRPDAALYLDEAQQFLHMPHSLEDLLARARAYRMPLVLAHQNLGQLKTAELKAAISTNTLTKIYFRSPEDARELERHTQPQLTAHDIAHLDPYTAAARIHHHGGDTPAFTLATTPLPPLPTTAAPPPATTRP